MNKIIYSWCCPALLYFCLMKRSILTILCVLICLTLCLSAKSQGKLEIIIIRHGEKQEQNENLDCMGLNRSLKLVNVLNKKIGVPDYIYIPTIGNGKKTTRSRMFQTISPFVIKYNLSINSAFSGTDFSGIVQDLKGKKGVVLFVWDHANIVELAKALGVHGKNLKWSDADFDSMWIITGKSKDRELKIDREGIVPGANCPVF